MKFSLLCAVYAECRPLHSDRQALAIWQEYGQRMGALPFPESIAICQGNEYFHEVAGGAKMDSALDRRHLRIVLRRRDLDLLRHELAHLYLDLRWQVLPYPIAEPFAQALAQRGSCPPINFAGEALHESWERRLTLDDCGRLALLRALLAAPASERNRLPLR